MYTLIKATEEDFPFLVALRLKTMDVHMKNHGLRLSVTDHEQRVRFQYQHFNIVKVGDVVIGAVKFEHLTHATYVHQIQVKPEYQRSGHGRGILNQVIAQSPCDRVELKVLRKNPAYRLYQSMGFVVVSEEGVEYAMRLNTGK